MKQIVALWLLVAGCALFPPAQSAPLTAPVGDPFLTRFSPAELNVYPQNFDLVQGSDGIIYVANSEGVLEFDGAHWRLVKLPEGEFARSLAVDSRGLVFVGSFNHFGYLERDASNDNQFVDLTLQFVGPQDAVKLADVWDVVVTSTGVFFSTRYAVFLWREGAPAGTWTSDEGFGGLGYVHERMLVRDRDQGLLEFKQGELVLIPGTEVFTETRINDYVALPNGKVLIIAEDQFYLLDGEKLAPFPLNYQELPRSTHIYRALMLADGQIAMGTTSGDLHIISADGDSGRSYTLSDYLISGLMIATDGSLWAATDEDIVRIDIPSPWSYFGSRNGFSGFVTDTVVFDDQRLIATNVGVFRLLEPDAGGGRPSFERLDWGDNEFWDLMIHGDDLLVADSHKVYRVAGELLEPITGMIYPRRLRASRFTNNVVFVGGESGFTTLVKTQGQWQVMGEFNDMNVRAYYIVEESERVIWIGTYGSSAYRIELSKDYSSIVESRQFGQSDGLKLDVTGGVVVSQVLDTVIFSTDEGLFQFNGEVFVAASHPVFKSYGELPVGVEFSTTETGEVWASTGREVFRGRRIADTWSWEKLHLGPYDNTAVEALVVESSGLAWIGAASALLRFETDFSEAAIEPASILLRRMELRQPDQTIESIEIRGDTSPVIAWGRHTLIFQYALPSYANAQAVEFQTLLEGFETEWTGWNREAERSYTSIDPGLYLFRVRARSLEGVLPGEASVAFRVSPPWSRTPWAYSLAAASLFVIAVVLTVLMVRWRSGSLRRQNRALETKLRLREEELHKREEDLHAANKLLEDLALQDGLTGLANRQRLEAYLQEMWQHCLEQQQPLSLLMIDADHFKQFNDANGHLAGDEVLRVLATTLNASITDPKQLLARFSGEEFAAVLPGIDQSAARELAQFMRQAVIDAKAKMKNVTVSIGVGEIQPGQGDKVDLLLQRADEAMYQAKREGRNRVV